MIRLAIMGGLAFGAIWVFHIIHSRQQNTATMNSLIDQAKNAYLGAPAWPPLPQQNLLMVALPTDVRALPTYYGVDENLLNEDIANAS